MSAATTRLRDPQGRFARPDPDETIPNAIHTIRIANPTWDAAKTLAWFERRQDGVSEIIREVLGRHMRAKLREFGIDIPDDAPLTEEHAARFYETARAA